MKTQISSKLFYSHVTIWQRMWRVKGEKNAIKMWFIKNVNEEKNQEWPLVPNLSISVSGHMIWHPKLGKRFASDYVKACHPSLISSDLKLGVILDSNCLTLRSLIHPPGWDNMFAPPIIKHQVYIDVTALPIAWRYHKERHHGVVRCISKLILNFPSDFEDMSWIL